MSETATDFLGQEYGVGDFVVYATTSGRSPVQKLARVEKIWQKTRTWYTFEGEPGNRKLVERSSVETKVGVREIKNGRGFRRWDAERWNRETQQYEKNPDGARITYPMTENIVKVNPPEVG